MPFNVDPTQAPLGYLIQCEYVKSRTYGAGGNIDNWEPWSRVHDTPNLRPVGIRDTGVRNLVITPLGRVEPPRPHCDCEPIDDGGFIQVCPKCGRQEDHEPKWRDMATAPRDGTMVRLLVRFTDHPTDDSEEAATIGAYSEDGGWKFAGWCWSHDHFTEGKGEPIGWLPMFDEPTVTYIEVEEGDQE